MFFKNEKKKTLEIYLSDVEHLLLWHVGSTIFISFFCSFDPEVPCFYRSSYLLSAEAYLWTSWKEHPNLCGQQSLGCKSFLCSIMVGCFVPYTSGGTIFLKRWSFCHGTEKGIVACWIIVMCKVHHNLGICFKLWTMGWLWWWLS